MTEVVLTTAAIKYAKLQSNHHHQQTNTQFFDKQYHSIEGMDLS